MYTAVLIVAAAIVAGALTLQGWLLLQVREQQIRVSGRIDGLDRPAPRLAAPAPSVEVLDPPVSVRAPDFELANLDGGRVTLRGLLARAKPILLLFTDPRCGPCYDLLPDIGGWQRVYADRVSFVLISAGAVDANRAMTAEYGIRDVLLQTELEVVTAYNLGMAPAALLIRTDGTIDGEAVYGVDPIRHAAANALGLAMPEKPAHVVAAAKRGAPAPVFRRPDLFDNVIDLAAFRGAATLLLFWSPGCSHCAGLLPELKTWETATGGPQLLVVSRGPAGLNRELGLTSPVVLDEDRVIATSFGSTGTPAGVLIDARGIIVSDVARGATGVCALAGQAFAVLSQASS